MHSIKNGKQTIQQMVKVRMKIVILIIIKFFLISALFIVSNENLHFNDAIERAEFFDHYSTWLGRTFDQTVGLVDSVLDLKWLPDNNFTRS